MCEWNLTAEKLFHISSPSTYQRRVAKKIYIHVSIRAIFKRLLLFLCTLYSLVCEIKRDIWKVISTLNFFLHTAAALALVVRSMNFYKLIIKAYICNMNLFYEFIIPLDIFTTSLWIESPSLTNINFIQAISKWLWCDTYIYIFFFSGEERTKANWLLLWEHKWKKKLSKRKNSVNNLFICWWWNFINFNLIITFVFVSLCRHLPPLTPLTLYLAKRLKVI